MVTAIAKEPSRAKSRYELWQDTIDGALTDSRWHDYDCDIQRIVSQFNRHLSGTAGFIPLEWLLIKAMIWTESGGPDSRAWRDNPIQIGNPGDPGLAALFSGNEGGSLIIPPEMQSKLTIASARVSPQLNISAGVAYLLMRLAKFDFATVPHGLDKAVYDVLVKPGDTLEKIAKANGTTIDTLRKRNGGVFILRPGQTLAYQKASVQKVITRWTAISATSIARLYNVGDPAYARKLTYCLEVMKKAKHQEASCVP
jgi:hypothetical protein